VSAREKWNGEDALASCTCSFATSHTAAFAPPRSSKHRGRHRRIGSCQGRWVQVSQTMGGRDVSSLFESERKGKTDLQPQGPLPSPEQRRLRETRESIATRARKVRLNAPFDALAPSELPPSRRTRQACPPSIRRSAVGRHAEGELKARGCRSTKQDEPNHS
jgi:hypothetical protein